MKLRMAMCPAEMLPAKRSIKVSGLMNNDINSTPASKILPEPNLHPASRKCAASNVYCH